jgi:hypothetical protein
MALVLADRVKETTTTTGTGTVTLLGAATGFQSFSVVGNGNTTYYCIAGQTGGEWEVGVGTYTSSGTTLARTTVLASSNAGSAVNFSAGTKDVFVTYPAGYTVNTQTGTATAATNATTVTNGFYTTSSFNLGTTSIAVNRASGSQSLTGINIDGSSGSCTGNAATATTATTATTANATNTSNNFQMNSLGVGTAGSGTGGEIRATNNITAYYSSDAKFKENVQPIIGAMEIVRAIGADYFDWTDAYIAEHGGEDGYFIQKQDFGVIAQKVQAVFPKAVRTRPDGSLAVDYEKLGVLAFPALIEQEERIARLEAIVAELTKGN